MTEVDQIAMSEAFRRNNIGYDEAVDAIYALVNDGEVYQPRSPAIVVKVKHMRREKAREAGFARALERGTVDSVSAEQAKVELQKIIDRIASKSIP